MPTLRELLDAQKLAKMQQPQGGQNAASSTQLSQQQSIKEASKTISVDETTQGKETIATTNNNRGSVQQIGGASGQIEAPVGLKGLDLIKWRKTHGSISSSSISNGKRETETIETAKIKIEETTPTKTNETNTPQPNGKIDTTELRRNLEYLANHIEQKELVGQIVRTIAVQLKQSPELTPYMSDADVDLVVRGLRRAYAIVARKKSEARDAKTNRGKVDADLAQQFKDAGLDGLNLGLKL